MSSRIKGRKKKSDVNQIVNDIKEEIASPEPSSNRIINDFYDFLSFGSV